RVLVGGIEPSGKSGPGPGKRNSAHARVLGDIERRIGTERQGHDVRESRALAGAICMSVLAAGEYPDRAGGVSLDDQGLASSMIVFLDGVRIAVAILPNAHSPPQSGRRPNDV